MQMEIELPRFPYQPPPEGYVLISGSYGHFLVNRSTGRFHDDVIYDGDEYRDIVRFDTADFDKQPEHSCFDIVEVGFWTDKDEYVAAVPEKERFG